MTRTRKTFASSLLGVGLALAALGAPAAAQEAPAWLNDASRCDIFRALNEWVPASCARPGDHFAEPADASSLGKTRGLTPRGIQFIEQPASGVTPIAEPMVEVQEPAPAEPQVAAVQQSSPPSRKSLNARIQFEFDSFNLTGDAKAELDRLAEVLKDDLMQSKVVEIEGHADAVGSEGYNVALSQLRARSVRAYLIEQHGIAADRLPFLGKGEAEPYDPANPTAAENRRVVFTNLTG
jgi:outer membrane protein OmpA-like peptidoglycan-associated protein